MKFFKNKKSSLELSIKTIVVVVLAMTLLGLGLGFIRSMFKDISGISTDVSAQVREKILDDLITGDKKVSFPKTEIVIDKGKSETLTVGLRNKNDDALFYKIQFNPISDPNGDVFSIESPRWFQFAEGVEYELAAAGSDVRNIRLSMPTSVNAGSYFLTFDVIDADDNSVYATKDFFIVVRG